LEIPLPTALPALRWTNNEGHNYDHIKYRGLRYK